jgi:uncharacterized membrane protein
VSNSGGFDRRDVARCWAGFASFGAGLIHVAVVREHFAESWTHGTFFAVVGLAQIAWALLALHQPVVPIPRLTGVATLGLIGLWVVSRTVGLALDPQKAVREPVGTPDLLAVVLEVALILCILAALPRLATSPSPEPAGPQLDEERTGLAASGRVLALLAAGALAVSAIATPGMAATLAGQHAHGHGHSH